MTPPVENCTHPSKKLLGCVFFFLQECFGIIIPFEKPKIDNPGWQNWTLQQRDEHGTWIKLEK